MFHEVTERLIQSLRKNSPQALLLTGKAGVGLQSVARSVAEGGELTMVEADRSKALPVISVETMRQLYDETRSKQLKNHFVVIDQADVMTHQAQNAFLKLLEEPNDNTYFILLSSHPEALLPTILSRVQRHVVRPISHQQSLSFIKAAGDFDQTKTQQLLFMAAGLPEKLKQLIDDEELFLASVEMMKSARNFLQADAYQKLQVIASLAGNRSQSIALLDSAVQITHHSLRQNPKSGHIKQLSKLIQAKQRLEANQNVRLSLALAVI